MVEHGTETNNQEEHGTGTDNQDSRTFTQEEVDAIVLKRIGKEKARFADYDDLKAKADKYDEIQEEGKTDLQKITDKYNELQSKYDSMVKADSISKIRNAVADQTGVPSSLLTADTEEECKAQAQAILEFAKPKEYPGVKKNKSITHKASAEDQAMREFAQQIFRKGE